MSGLGCHRCHQGSVGLGARRLAWGCGQTITLGRRVIRADRAEHLVRKHRSLRVTVGVRDRACEFMGLVAPKHQTDQRLDPDRPLHGTLQRRRATLLFVSTSRKTGGAHLEATDGGAGHHFRILVSGLRRVEHQGGERGVDSLSRAAEDRGRVRNGAIHLAQFYQ